MVEINLVATCPEFFGNVADCAQRCYSLLSMLHVTSCYITSHFPADQDTTAVKNLILVIPELLPTLYEIQALTPDQECTRRSMLLCSQLVSLYRLHYAPSTAAGSWATPTLLSTAWETALLQAASAISWGSRHCRPLPARFFEYFRDSSQRWNSKTATAAEKTRQRMMWMSTWGAFGLLLMDIHGAGDAAGV